MLNKRYKGTQRYRFQEVEYQLQTVKSASRSSIGEYGAMYMNPMFTEAVACMVACNIVASSFPSAVKPAA